MICSTPLFFSFNPFVFPICVHLLISIFPYAVFQPRSQPSWPLADHPSPPLALDLPHPSSHPNGALLLSILSRLKLQPIDFSGQLTPSPDLDEDSDPDFSSNTANDHDLTAILDPCSTTPLQIHGSPTPWLTSLVSSRLAWLPNDEIREQIWDAASARLAERAGSMGQSSLTRTIKIPSSPSSLEVSITLREPAIVSSHLGTKTWGSAYLLSCALDELAEKYAPSVVLRSAVKSVGGLAETNVKRTKVLELGAGTGLVGLVASALWWADVHMTDLEGAVLDNLSHNVETNAPELAKHHGASNLRVFPLDWSSVPAPDKIPEQDRFPVILAADAIYEAEHSPWLANAVAAYLVKTEAARFVVELPCRKGYEDEREYLVRCLQERGLVRVAEGVHWGWDEFGDPSEKREHRWGVWKWKEVHV